jgi:hypothetical protein
MRVGVVPKIQPPACLRVVRGQDISSQPVGDDSRHAQSSERDNQVQVRNQICVKAPNPTLHTNLAMCTQVYATKYVSELLVRQSDRSRY